MYTLSIDPVYHTETSRTSGHRRIRPVGREVDKYLNVIKFGHCETKSCSSETTWKPQNRRRGLLDFRIEIVKMSTTR